MKRFNLAKEQRKLNRKINLANNIKIRTIILSIFVLVGSIMLFTYSKYSTSVKLDIMHSKVANFMQDDYIINAYVDGDEDDFPGKNDGYYVDQVVCNKGATGTWDDDEWGIIITGADEEETECNVYFKTIQAVFEFEFDPDNDGNGQVQTFTVPFDGTYKLETWGAQGGYAYNSTYHGGYGGYSVGTFELNANENIYVVVGGKGTDGPTYGTYNGGYNGGGTGSSKRNNEHEFIVGAGGGATHIAKDSGLLSSLSSHASDNRILIVSGGGGGATYNNNAVEASWRGYNYGGSGGGYNGGHVYGTVSNTTASLGGLQEPREQSEFSGDFGQGAIGTYYGTTSGASCGSWPNYCRQIAGGGGGYYGGASGWGHGGGGGSGYIANTLLTNKHMYCFNCPTSTETNINTISDGTDSCHNSNATEDCAKEGNGFARITLISRS